MKRMILQVIFSCLFVSGLWAQNGLNIAQLFDGRYKQEANAIEVLVKGRKLEPYKLTLFRSLTVKNDPEKFDKIEELVTRDGRQALDKETGMIGGKLYYAFFRLPPKGKSYRYLFFRNSSLRTVESDEVTVVYMEGYATLEELKQLFK